MYRLGQIIQGNMRTQVPSMEINGEIQRNPQRDVLRARQGANVSCDWLSTEPWDSVQPL